MKILGLQRTTLVDYPGKVACTIFLFGCNFRCGFCYNPLLVLGNGEGEVFSEDEVLSFLEKRQGKLDAVCVTGGEPLMTLDFDFLRKIKSMGYLVKIDTNGSFPEKLKELIDEGLVDYISMDVKTSRENYSEVVGVNVDISKVEESIKLIYDFGSYEFRTTILNKFHNKGVVLDMGAWLNEVCGGEPKRLFLQGFKSKEDLIDKSLVTEPDVSEKYLEELREVALGYFEEVGVRV